MNARIISKEERNKFSVKEKKLGVDELRDKILWFIGAPTHLIETTPCGKRKEIKVKEKAGVATYKEIKTWLDNNGIKASRRTIYRRLKELEKVGLIRSGEKRGEYEITPLGKERCNLLDAVAKAQARLASWVLPEGPIHTLIMLGPTVNGRTQYVDFHIRITDPDYVRKIEKVILSYSMDELKAKNYRKGYYIVVSGPKFLPELNSLMLNAILTAFNSYQYGRILEVVKKPQTQKYLLSLLKIFEKSIENSDLREIAEILFPKKLRKELGLEEN
ncbi:MAG: hypothetical protein DRN90_05315 [Thermoproteota archaeon]|nr:MAG: hypothetical protein DRN90_05315 [Candidatus Korarchaeota archaeon]